MNQVKKLRVLIPHWIKHNQEHAAEFRRWAAEAKGAAADIMEAADGMDKVNVALQVALEKLGGPLDYSLEGEYHEHTTGSRHDDH